MRWWTGTTCAEASQGPARPLWKSGVVKSHSLFKMCWLMYASSARRLMSELRSPRDSITSWPSIIGIVRRDTLPCRDILPRKRWKMWRGFGELTWGDGSG